MSVWVAQIEQSQRIRRLVTRNMALYKTPLLLALVVMFALALRVYQIDRESLWFDEAFTYWAAVSSPPDIIKTWSSSLHPPLYGLMLHYWMKIVGDSDMAIRLLSAIFGVLAIPVVFQIGKLLFNDRFGLAAALFLSVSGFHIQYSQEARPYSLYFLLTSVSILFTILAHKRIRYAWFGYIISTVLLLYTHNTAVLAVVAIMLFYLILAWPWRPASVYHFLLATLVVAICYTPWIPVYLSHAIQVTESYWTSSLKFGQVLATLTELVLIPPGANIPRKIQYGLLGVPFSVLLLSLPGLWAKEKKILIALVLLFLIPVGTNLIVSIFIRNIFILRVLIPALLPLPILLSTPILMEKEEPLFPYRRLALAAMASMMLISLIGSIGFLRHNSKEPWRQAAEILQKNYKPGDVIVHLWAGNEIGLIRYLPPKFYHLPAVAIPAGRYLNLGPSRAEPLNKEEKDKTGIETLQALKAKNGRIWLVHRYSPSAKSRYKNVMDIAMGWLDANYKKTRELKHKSLQLVLYEPL